LSSADGHAAQVDLSLAYTPGVAEPCLEIARDPLLAYEYTSKGNLVAVISNGTAVLGLGDIGAIAGKPVMEGKGVLFKRFAGIDVFDIELDTHDPEEIIRTVKLLEPTFGGINLEDIKAPECFYIEEQLHKTMRIPFIHDDQHGTAIITGAALINGLELVNKTIDKARIVFSGAGAAALATASHYLKLGARRENIIMYDIHGIVYRGRTEGMNPYMERFASETSVRTLAEALRGADVFVGLSAGNVVTPEMLRGMADHPIIFAMANPDPEIPYEQAVEARPDAIVATGRSTRWASPAFSAGRWMSAPRPSRTRWRLPPRRRWPTWSPRKGWRRTTCCRRWTSGRFSRGSRQPLP